MREREYMKIRWITSDIEGTFHNDPLGVHRGEVVDVDEMNAIRYIANGYAVPVSRADKAEYADIVPVPEPPSVAFGSEELPPSESPPSEPVTGTDMGGDVEPEPHFPDKEFVADLGEAVRPEPEVEVVEAKPVKLVEPESEPKKAVPRPSRPQRVPPRSRK
jgi:hypothetical protein